MKTMRFLAFFLSLQLLGTAQKTTTYVAHFREPFSGPQAYKDPKSGMLLLVESDGRHLAAISPAGKLLWDRDPFKDVPSYRFENPQVVYLGPATRSAHRIEGGPDKFVAIALANSQFGLLRMSDGDFEFEGQD